MVPNRLVEDGVEKTWATAVLALTVQRSGKRRRVRHRRRLIMDFASLRSRQGETAGKFSKPSIALKFAGKH
jgi:hypothetical protein